MLLPPPRSQVADSAGLGLPPPIWANPTAVIRKMKSVRQTILFCMFPPGVGSVPMFWTLSSKYCQRTNYTPRGLAVTIDPMPVFDDKQEELEHYETMMGIPRGRLAVTMDMITDAMALVGQHGVYCQSQRWPGKPVMDIQIIMKNLTDAKELIQSVMEALKK